MAASNSRYVSVKQGVDVTANQEEISEHETFQLEFDAETAGWFIRTKQDKYFSLQASGGVQACETKKVAAALFQVLWGQGGSVSIRASNGKLVGIKKSGHLFANCEPESENSRFYFYLVNRPVLVLKCDQGFVGYKAVGSVKVECNKASYETIHVERAEAGAVHLRGNNGKYWQVEGDSVSCNGDTPQSFHFEVREPTRMCIKDGEGNYLVSMKNGGFGLGTDDVETATRWEY